MIDRIRKKNPGAGIFPKCHNTGPNVQRCCYGKLPAHKTTDLHDSLHLFGFSYSLTLPTDTLLLLVFKSRPVNLEPTS